MNFKKWVKSIQTAGYNGARTVYFYFALITSLNRYVLQLPTYLGLDLLQELTSHATSKTNIKISKKG